MKKLLLLAAMTLTMALPATAQRAFYNPSNTDERTDTATQAATMYLNFEPNSIAPVTTSIYAVKVSGTVSAVAYLEGSCDPAKATGSYVILDSVAIGNTTTASGGKQLTQGYPKLRWRIVPTGTQAFIVKAWAWK